MYGIGEYVIYGTSGVCVIADICDSPVKADDRKYYVLKPVYANGGSTIFTPVGNDKVSMRKLITADEAEELIVNLPAVSLVEVQVEKQRRDAYKEAFSTNEPERWASIIKTVRHRRHTLAKMKKKLTETDVEYEMLAKKSLYGEISTVLGIPDTDIENYIARRIKGESAI